MVERGRPGEGEPNEIEIEKVICDPYADIFCQVFPWDDQEPGVLAARAWMQNRQASGQWHSACTLAMQRFDQAVAEFRVWTGQYSSTNEDPPNHAGVTYIDPYSGLTITHIDRDNFNRQTHLVAWIILHEAFHHGPGGSILRHPNIVTAPYGGNFDLANLCSGYTP